MISESKLDDSFPHGQFLIEGFQAPLRFDLVLHGSPTIKLEQTMMNVTYS